MPGPRGAGTPWGLRKELARTTPSSVRLDASAPFPKPVKAFLLFGEAQRRFKGIPKTKRIGWTVQNERRNWRSTLRAAGEAGELVHAMFADVARGTVLSHLAMGASERRQIRQAWGCNRLGQHSRIQVRNGKRADHQDQS